jgi:hypothetical protein
MIHKRRQLQSFSLSFLDVMSCGLGAVILLFLIMKHNVEARLSEARGAQDLAAQADLLKRRVRDGQEKLAELETTVADIDQRIVLTRARARRIEKRLEEAAGSENASRSSGEIAALQARVNDLEQKKNDLEKEAGDSVRPFAGESSRRYLTGLTIGGERILILLDTSASMLDETIVNILRSRNMSDDHKLASPKWRRAVRTVDWLTARFPPGSRYQIYLFDTETRSALPHTEGSWLEVGDVARLDRAVEAVNKTVPHGGTSLEGAFAALRRLEPPPDNVYLITDGLPTQGAKGAQPGSRVSASERLELFDEALERLPRGVPVNTILLPLEGDPVAAEAFWELAIRTRGSFMSPARDWP